jgi:ubiquinone/menaquinone biosynthesis C-methylase UbiE
MPIDLKLQNPFKLFEHQAKFYTNSRPLHDPRAVDEALRQATLPTNPVILDLGGGTGTLSEHIANNAAPVRMHLVEPQPDMREEGLKRLAETSDCPHIVVANGTSSVMPFPDQYADAIVMANAAHWFLSDYDNTLRELDRLLKPDGKIIILYTMLDQEDAFTAKLHDLFVQHCKEYTTKRSQFLKPQEQTPTSVSKKYIGHHVPVHFTREIAYISPEEFLHMLQTYSFYPHDDSTFEGQARQFFEEHSTDGQLLTQWQSTAHVGCIERGEYYQPTQGSVGALVLLQNTKMDR